MVQNKRSFLKISRCSLFLSTTGGFPCWDAWGSVWSQSAYTFTTLLELQRLPQLPCTCVASCCLQECAEACNQLCEVNECTADWNFPTSQRIGLLNGSQQEGALHASAKFQQSVAQSLLPRPREGGHGRQMEERNKCGLTGLKQMNNSSLMFPT